MEAPGSYLARFDEMFGVAYRAAFAVLGDRGDAEDCAQETLTKALIGWRRTEPKAVAWVARVATNTAIDRWRKRARSQPSALQVEMPVSDDSIAVFGHRDDLVRALGSLPRRQREAVVFRHLLDFSEAETASALRCSVGTVKSSTSRGLTQLRSLLVASAHAGSDPVPN